MTRIVPRSLVATLLSLTFVMAGCDKGEKKDKKPDEDEASAADQGLTVQLPARPDFNEGKIDERYNDNVWSIYGLRKSLDENVKAGDAGAEIEVRGYVQEIYQAPVCEGNVALCPPGKQPHFWITDRPDDAGKKRAMMVVSYAFSIPEWEAKTWKDVPNVIINKGEQYTIKGRFKRFSDSGFADDRGLVEFIAYKATDPKTGMEGWIYPPGAAWHPINKAAEEEQQRKLIEAASKAAAANRGK